MRNIKFILTGLATVFTVPFYGININHGPYLQEVTNTGATFVFNTSSPSYSYIELKKDGEAAGKVYYQSVNGLKQANCSRFAVRADGLLPATRYSYRIISFKFRKFNLQLLIYKCRKYVSYLPPC